MTATTAADRQVLVLNAGSSSIKYRLFGLGDDDTLTEAASGLVERIGEPGSRVTHRLLVDGTWQDRVDDDAIDDHRTGLAGIVRALRQAGLMTDLAVIGHRVVHGGSRFVAPALITAEVLESLREQVPLAPLHNPANLIGIEVATAIQPEVPQVAVFDTAFHATLPPHAYRYAVPEEVYARHGVRRYGFHGTSHAFVARRAARFLDRPLSDLDLITLHLGNGASAAAIQGGRSIDTSMGLSPLEGLVMGTRSGDVDPAVVFHLVRQVGMTLDEVDTLLNKRSGLRGLCGDNDLRTIESRAADGDNDAELALEVYAYRIRKYLGAYTAALGGLDAVVFTAGVGENAAGVRARIARGLEVLGIRIDADRNRAAKVTDAPDGVVALHPEGAAVAVLAVATDEEREIAGQSLRTIRSG
ncbi:MAG: acetate kinase [Nitriliruptor sp.]|nr:MAG: acetate kinase [Nitriliruptor sp.]